MKRSEWILTIFACSIIVIQFLQIIVIEDYIDSIEDQVTNSYVNRCTPDN